MTPATTDRSPKTYATSLVRQISFAMSIIYTRITPQTFTFLFFFANNRKSPHYLYYPPSSQINELRGKTKQNQ